MALDDTSPIEDAMKRIIGNPAAKAASGDVQLTTPPSLLSYAPGAFDWKKQTGTTAKTTQTPVAAPVASAPASAPASATDPNASLYSWTTPRERDAAAAAAKQGINYWGTTSPESRKAAFASEDAVKNYAYRGQEWNDPLAKQIYLQFNPGDMDYDWKAKVNNTYAPGGVNYGRGTNNSTIDPMKWENAYKGEKETAMKNALIKAGGGAVYGMTTSPYGK